MSHIRNLVQSLNRKPATSGEAEPTVRPAYDIKEAPEAWGLTAYLPGVTKDGLELTAEEGLITVRGRRQWRAPSGWTTLYRESTDAMFELALTHDNTIDVNRIHAELKDGVLRVSLPKADAIRPRKIAVS